MSIPVVFHVLYANSTENIADSEIQEQLQTLNDDFRRLNSDADDTIWAQAADTEIEFCLASFDPVWIAPTNGILRVPTTVSSFGIERRHEVLLPRRLGCLAGFRLL